MSSYDRSWTVAAATLLLIGLWGAYRGFDLAVLLAMAVTVSVLAVMWALPFVPHDQPLTRPLVRAGVVGAVVTWVLMGMAHLAGYVGVVAVLSLIALSPVLRSRYRPLLAQLRGRRPRPGRQQGSSLTGPVADAVPPLRPVPPVAAPEEPLVEAPFEVPQLPDATMMSDLELCRAWRESFVLLGRAATAQARFRLALARASYLDELERRGGDAFRAWLDSGARAAGDPSRCLDAPRRGDGHRSVAD